MQLIANGTQGPSTIPAKQTPVGTPGYANSGTPGAFAPTVADPDIFNTILAEFVSVVLASGQTLDPANNAQLLQAVRSLPGKNIQVFAASGSFTVPAGLTKLRARVLGGGGGASGQPSTQAGAAGGGGGGYAEGIYSVTPAAVITVTVGAGGAGGASGFSSGTAGGTSSFGSLCSASGGQPGGSASGYAAGGPGGAGFGGQINISGSCGGDGYISGTVPGYGGAGAVLGSSVRAGTFSVASSGNAAAPGSGGSGSYLYGTAVGGGAGAAGLVIVEW